MIGSGRSLKSKAVMLAAISAIAGLVETSEATSPARADVQKVLFVCVHGRTKQICPQLRASLRAPDGWVEDRTAEAKQGRVIYVPKGKTFDTAPQAITVQTTPNRAKTAPDVLTQRDQDNLKQEHKDVTILPLPPIDNPRLGGPVKLFKLIVPDLKVRNTLVETRFLDKDADGQTYSVEVTLSAQNDKTLAEVKPKFDQMIKGY